MSNNLSRRQKAKLRAETQPQQNPIEIKSIFSALSNNPSININLFEQLMATISQDSKLAQVVEGNSTLSTCVDIIAMKVATISLSLYKQQRDGTFIPVKGKRHTDHILSKPNLEDTQITLLFKLVSYFLTYGNAYLIKANNQVFALPPTKVYPNKVSGITQSYKVVLNTDIQLDVPAKLVCQIFKPSLSGKYSSTVRNAIADVILNSEIINQSSNHVKSGMMAKGLLIQDKDSSSGLSQTQMTQLSKQFTDATAGSKSANTIMLPKGISYQTVQQTAADSSLIELLEQSRKAIVRAFKIPESIFNSEAGASYATANVQEMNFYKNTIKPICMFIESFINYWDQLTSETEYFKFELGDMTSAEEEQMKANTKQVKANTAMTLKSIGLYSPNDIREASGHEDIVDINENPIEEADVNPFEVGTFAQEDAPVEEPIDDNSLVKKIDIVKRKSVKCKTDCKCGE